MIRPRKEQYPNSTQEHRAIPLEIVQPLAATDVAVDNVTPVTVDLAGFEVLSFEAAGTDVWLEFSSAAATIPPTPGTLLANALYLGEGDIAVLSLFEAEQVHIVGVTGSGAVYINALGRWVSLNSDYEVTNL